MAKLAPIRFPPLPTVGELLKLYGITAKKRLSQNFLFDSKLRSKLVSASGGVKNCRVIEVGPGPGGLTRSIFQQGSTYVDVVEKDVRFLPTLELLREVADNRLSIHIGDILHFPMKHLVPEELSCAWESDPPPIQLIGNLPFNVSTPLIIKWLELISLRSDLWSLGRVPMTLTFQHEIGHRMISKVNDFQRSRLSIMVQNWCDVEYKFQIPGRAFVPKPDVNVAVMHFVPRINPLIPIDFRTVEKVVYHVFAHRQKYCQFGIERLFPLAVRVEYTKKMLAVADIDPTKRSFQLTLEEFDRIIHAYEAITLENPTIKKFGYKRSESFSPDGFYL